MSLYMAAVLAAIYFCGLKATAIALVVSLPLTLAAHIIKRIWI